VKPNACQYEKGNKDGVSTAVVVKVPGNDRMEGRVIKQAQAEPSSVARRSFAL